ncbi:MAG: amidohydrolase family protein [Coriobacteriia bacterium]|nr:amidohydrolase family protein [Coriobacteriia bacterium]MBN2821938.1 amidohydrolase family protein [Coriobacteriia bacterium]
MIIAGDWAITPGAKTLEHGAVLISGNRIHDVDTKDALVARHPGAVLRDHPGCVIMPGLVNAHTHLALTALHGVVPPDKDLPSWIDRITRVILSLNGDDFAASAAEGASQCLLGGTTVAGDIVYGPESTAAAGDTGLGGVYFWEVLGINASRLPETLQKLEFPGTPVEECPPRMRCGLSPHTPYTSGPELLKAMKRTADELRIPFCIHAAESSAELQLLKAGTGPFASKAERLAQGFQPPRMGAIRYLDSLGVLDDAIVVHCVHLQAGESHLLARKSRGVVLCPRSNALLGNGEPPVRKLLDAGVRIALGTDSAASNTDLDLFAEARVLKEIEPSLTASQLVLMMTETGADVLGLGDRFGRLKIGYNADVIAMKIGDTGHPLEALVSSGAAHNVKAVVSGGAARVLGGMPTFSTISIRQAAARVTEKANRAAVR